MWVWQMTGNYCWNLCAVNTQWHNSRAVYRRPFLNGSLHFVLMPYVLQNCWATVYIFQNNVPNSNTVFVQHFYTHVCLLSYHYMQCVKVKECRKIIYWMHLMKHLTSLISVQPFLVVCNYSSVLFLSHSFTFNLFFCFHCHTNAQLCMCRYDTQHNIFVAQIGDIWLKYRLSCLTGKCKVIHHGWGWCWGGWW